jgi:hypothetical protein
VHNSHLALPENTVENPSPDGGGQLSLDTAWLTGASGYNGMYDGTPVTCQNAVRSYQNEDNCKLSYLTSACSPDTREPLGQLKPRELPRSVPKTVIVLNYENLEGMSAASGKKLYAVRGLVIPTANVYPGTGTGAPCGLSNIINARNAGTQKSRWIKDESDLVCNNSANLLPKTLKLFRDAIDGRDADLNQNIANVEKTYRDCDENDKDKLELGKVKASDGSCWEHVHYLEHTVYDLTGFAGVENYVVPGTRFIEVPEDIFDSYVFGQPFLGKYGDHIILEGRDIKLTPPLSDSAIQAQFKSFEFNPSGR